MGWGAGTPGRSRIRISLDDDFELGVAKGELVGRGGVEERVERAREKVRLGVDGLHT